MQRLDTGDRAVYDGVQVLRFVAAFMVVMTHSTFYTHERLTSSFPVWGRGVIGVDIFFVISGFVMYVASAHLIGCEGGWREFIVRRLVRIVPLYWLTTSFKLAILLLLPAAVLHSHLDWAYVAKSYFFIPAYNVDGNIEPLLGVGWTLLFEMFFYGIFALVLALRLPVIPSISVVMLVCASLALVRKPDWPAISVYFDPRVLEFVAGLLIGRYIAKARLPIWVTIASLAVGWLAVFALPWSVDPVSRLATHVVPSALVVVGFVGLEPYVAGRWPKVLTFLGAASYSLYLVHPLVAPASPQVAAKLGLASPWLAIGGSIALALLFGSLTYVLFEKTVSKLLGNATRPLYVSGSKPALSAVKQGV